MSLMGLRGVIAPFVGAALQQSGAMSIRGVFVLSAAMTLAGVGVQAVGMRRHKRLQLPDRVENRPL
jgi:hypothetical protein